MCMNRNCNHLNNVPTGKRHGRIWDINSKVALAAIHIGLGEHQLNAFLSILNMPTVSHKMFDQRSKRCGGDENITVCVDAGWQKRGSGRAYDSLTGKGQPEKICKSLPALAKHPFGDHSDCHTDWCRFIEETGMKYRSLPYGKPLSDKSLQASLQQIFSSYAEHSNKLANLESTQGNESFNKTVASKAPKSKHYGGSGSLGYRIAASVVQKNRGQIYTVDVRKFRF
ncbi:unnamed protein product [Mytilus edulis]|uniref:Mutator-like transposase domain-containing protein n=1 Tax=Mytilus edulis TaxID=6550 RepID=A0A8S3SGH2_MYTED|nr:unnamed protein product [Mytilus edulis]